MIQVVKYLEEISPEEKILREATKTRKEIEKTTKTRTTPVRNRLKKALKPKRVSNDEKIFTIRSTARERLRRRKAEIERRGKFRSSSKIKKTTQEKDEKTTKEIEYFYNSTKDVESITKILNENNSVIKKIHKYSRHGKPIKDTFYFDENDFCTGGERRRFVSGKGFESAKLTDDELKKVDERIGVRLPKKDANKKQQDKPSAP